MSAETEMYQHAADLVDEFVERGQGRWCGMYRSVLSKGQMTILWTADEDPIHETLWQGYKPDGGAA